MLYAIKVFLESTDFDVRPSICLGPIGCGKIQCYFPRIAKIFKFCGKNVLPLSNVMDMGLPKRTRMRDQILIVESALMLFMNSDSKYLEK